MIEVPWQEGTPGVKRSGSGARVKVSADGKGVVSHAGAALLRELATETGLAGAVTGALLDTYRGLPLHMPGRVFADLAVAIAAGAGAGGAGRCPGTGVAVWGGPRTGHRAADRLRRHDQHRVQRERERGSHVEEDVRLPSAAGVRRPARGGRR